MCLSEGEHFSLTSEEVLGDKHRVSVDFLGFFNDIAGGDNIFFKKEGGCITNHMNKHSITDLPLLQNLFQDVYYVFHPAALPSVLRSVENPLSTNKVNIIRTINIPRAAGDNNVEKIIYASSSSVYGDTPTLPKMEDMVSNPQSPYALTKLVGEYYCHIFHQIYDLPTICLRHFNVYGPRQDSDSQYAAVIPISITRLSQDKPPIIYGDGEQTQDFTFVKDAIQANIIGTESDACGAFNIGRGKSNTINDLTKTITRIMGKDVQSEYQPPQPGDVKHSTA